jgi:HEPN domain-containing protein
MQPSDPKLALTREWMVRADHDLLSADRMLLPPALPDVVAYHCQQAVEKALKAFLVWHDRPFARMHDLVDLLKLCIAVDAAFAQLAATAETVGPYITAFRYPGDRDAPPLPEAQAALRLARDAVTFVMGRLPSGARP